MQSIIWDWNGTLLNDLDFCISTINKLLKKRKLELVTHESYKAVFSFPVKDYYEAIGFDFSKEDFAIPAREFIDLYDAGVKNCLLHSSATEVLSYFKEKGIRQFVLSAMQQEMLNETLKQQGIFDYFEGVAGLNDHYAVSKIERGEQLISQFNINKEKATIIGDTIHDFEVAQQLGTDCILIADGHQSAERLQSTGIHVISDLRRLKELPL
ncbi:HAD hydrolase-like protein [Prolixibacteraceae bacterium Z1-6]|uniref:phosphoglycolate phosphatase n=1 Tax=Draconibacterium aestuarii TaxID=2998507 RepID=A0A9X3J6F4_9BACT|nr:HAD hydrolase-like protein [Prolixibacteraceae bacterium Z1-6]